MFSVIYYILYSLSLLINKQQDFECEWLFQLKLFLGHIDPIFPAVNVVTFKVTNLGHYTKYHIQAYNEQPSTTDNMQSTGNSEVGSIFH